VIQETLKQQRRVLDYAQPSSRETSNRSRSYSDTRRPYREPPDEIHYSRRHTRIDYDENDHDRRNEETYISTHEAPVTVSSEARASQLSPTDPQGVQGLLLQDSVSFIDKRIQDFREIFEQASDLEVLVSLSKSLIHSYHP
jgi:hypothetical protein